MTSLKSFIVPNLCKNTTVLSLVVATQLVAIVIALLERRTDFFTYLGMTSLYLQWVVLVVSFILCLARERVNQLNDRSAMLLVAATLFCIYLAVELFSQWASLGFTEFAIEDKRLSRHSVVAFIVILLCIRLFSITTVLEQRSIAEVESRIQALQSRIRPHFLFNSLNTIAELTATEPSRAEEAIDSLSQLFRASLESDKRFHSLESELNLCQRYVSLEQWRLEKRLQVDWQNNINRPRNLSVPKLILQPLIENAIVHGVGKDGSIRVSIDLRETRQDVSIMVENRRGDSPSEREGHGMAVDNIRERLFVLYDDKQTFRVRESADSYSVLMRFPKNRKDSTLETNSTMTYE